MSFGSIILFIPPDSVPIHNTPLSESKLFIKSFEIVCLFPDFAIRRVKLFFSGS